MIPFAEVLVDPTSGERLRRASDAQLERLVSAVKSGEARIAEGALPDAVTGAYVSEDGRVAFIDDASGFPSVLLERRITLDEAP